MDDQLGHIIEVLERFVKIRIIPNFDNCTWAKQSVKYCGYVVRKGIIRIDMNRLRIFKELKKPGTVEEICKMLVACNWARQFYKDFSKITAPWFALTLKEVGLILSPCYPILKY
eukprot:TRINITY_DN11266_c0_g2_i2.p1 TRINITY_DN11266_c0_g2~~TRINITY_DN11266_c0_g2_i2.p1  ORF type:complete len:114 (+),score=3.32 TRINITY_DN11266_c0_g2_i2:231-572(+)